MLSPEQTIATLAAMGVGTVLLIRAGRWFFSGPVKPAPWGEQISVALDEPESAPVCHRCLTEQSEVAHFCPKCGAAVGECNNLLPFERIFSEGEVVRNGTTQKMRPGFLMVAGYLVISLSMFTSPFLPRSHFSDLRFFTGLLALLISIGILAYWFVFWSLLIRNWTRPAEPPVADLNS